MTAAALGLYPRGELFVGSLVITAFVFSRHPRRHDGPAVRPAQQPWGAFLDSTLDRVADGAVFGGLVLWFAMGGDEPVLAVLALVCLVGGMVVSYAQGAGRGPRA